MTPDNAASNPTFHTHGHPLEQLLGETVVIDTASPYVYLGKLVAVTAVSIELAEADCHDLRDTQTNREKYVLDCRVHGVSPNRKRAWVRLDDVVGWCRLADVIVE